MIDKPAESSFQNRADKQINIQIRDATTKSMYPKAVKFSILTITLAITVIASATTTTADGAAAHFTFQHGNSGYHAVLADISNSAITPTAQFNPRLTNVWNMLGKSQPVAAITGTFFAYETQRPVADIIVNGERKATGYRGSIIAVDWYGRLSIINAATRKPFDYFAYRYAMRGGVRVVENGKINPNPRAQGFTDPAIWGSAARTGVGITKAGKLIMVATSQRVTLSGLGKAMASQGAVDAVSLDGGGSTMLYFNGSMKINSNRGLCNLFLIEKKSPFDAEFKNYLTRVADNQGQGALKGVLSSASGR